MPLEIKQTEKNSVPLEVEGIRPDSMRGKSTDAILKEKIFHGKEEVEFGEFFQVRGENDERFVWEGDLSSTHWIGAGLTGGEVRIQGNCGRHLGSEMSGGSIRVSGDASDWVGAEMTGGSIYVEGNAGHLVGAAYRGSPKGMSGGMILIHGKAGNEVGHTMCRGMIAVNDIGDLAGFNMLAGTILAFGECGIRHGAGMRRGTIAMVGKQRPEVLPTFRLGSRQELTLLKLTNRFLMKHEYPYRLPTTVDIFHGDLLEGGRGEMMISAET